MKLLLFTLMIYLTPAESEKLQAQFLKVLHRPGSHFYDQYFCCHSCGRGLEWHVDGNKVATHYTTSSIGSVEYRRENSSSSVQVYTSTILSKWEEDKITCMDVVLIISQRELRFTQAKCRGRTKQVIVNGSLDTTTDQSENTGNVSLNSVISRPGIITRKGDFVTHILICISSERSQYWRQGLQDVGIFNGGNSAGNSTFEVHPLYPSVVHQEAILLVRQPYIEITSVLILSHLYSVANFTVSCYSDTNLASTSISDPIPSDTNLASTSIADPIPFTSVDNVHTNGSITDYLSPRTSISQAQALCPQWVFLLLIVLGHLEVSAVSWE